MNDSELLKEKWETQRRMAAEANYSVRRILDNAEKVVAEVVKEHGVTLKYAKLKPTTFTIKKGDAPLF